MIFLVESHKFIHTQYYLPVKFLFFTIFRRAERSYWECTQRGANTARCPAMVTQVGATSFQRSCNGHIHEPNVGVSSALELKREVRRAARANMFTPASTLVDEAMNVLQPPTANDNLPVYDNVVSRLVIT